jgi:hypothetical protein
MSSIKMEAAASCSPPSPTSSLHLGSLLEGSSANSSSHDRNSVSGLLLEHPQALFL